MNKTYYLMKEDSNQKESVHVATIEFHVDILPNALLRAINKAKPKGDKGNYYLSTVKRLGVKTLEDVITNSLNPLEEIGFVKAISSSDKEEIWVLTLSCEFGTYEIYDLTIDLETFDYKFTFKIKHIERDGVGSVALKTEISKDEISDETKERIETYINQLKEEIK